MRAIELTGLAGPESLRLVETERPTPGPTEVLVHVRAAGVNFADVEITRGGYPASRPLPYTIGFEAAGVVVEVGRDVTNLRVGARVGAIMSAGAYAEYTVVDAPSVIPIPESVSFPEATTLLVQGITAYALLTYAAQVQPDESILVQTAAGGVGSFLVQLARQMGVERVAALAGAPEKLELLASLEGGFPRPQGPESDATLRPEGSSPQSGGSGAASVRSLAVVAWLPFIAKLAVMASLATIFLRVGAVTFGGGFVMIPIIEQSVVRDQGWLSHQEFADATALGQITPGPVLITATFIGYRVAGTVGALVATIAVFAPAFVFTVVAASSLRRFQSNPQVQAFLRGVTPAVVGLLVAAAWGVGHAGIHSWVGVTIAAVALVLILRFSVNGVAVIFGAGITRFLASLALGY